MFGIFKKKVTSAKASVAKMENRDQMEATIAGAIYLAFADGELEDCELNNSGVHRNRCRLWW